MSEGDASPAVVPGADPGHPLPATVTCPACRRRLAALTAKCPACGADLSPLVALRGIADRYFNEAVRRARDRQWNLAAENLAVTLALNADDAEAQNLLTEVRLRQRDSADSPGRGGRSRRAT